MYKDNKIGVIVPAYNEENFIGNVIDSVPSFVDRIFVVNDSSNDKTEEIINSKITQNSKVVLINRQARGGVGAAILSGHKRALAEKMDVLAVMAGDGQMDPAFLMDFIKPIAEGKVDYAKGNRLSSRVHRREMPTWRMFGNFLLTNLTRIATGYYHISDPQDGYTAISADVLKKIDLDRIEKGFAFENDILVKLNVIGARVVDIPHPAVYRGQDSKIRYSKFIFRTSYVLLRDFFWRIWVKYIRRAESPLRV
jgi:glycosyltransferase involved in cell wall biosynthesis